MKSTTFQQKIIFSAKVFACMLILGILSWLSFMPTTKTPAANAATADVTLSVTVIHRDPSIDVDEPGKVGSNIPIIGTSNNVDFVEVFLDDGDGIFDENNDILLSGTITIGANGELDGSVDLPSGTNIGVYELHVRGHTANNSGGTYPDYVFDMVVVDYEGDGPVIDCVHNTDNNCSILPGGDKPAYGGTDGGTIIVIDGENFGDENNTVVIIGDNQECVIQTITSTQITCKVPPAKDGQPGQVDVRVCVNDLCTRVENGFLYVELPETPDTGGIGTPGTGLFRLGDRVVTVKDMIWWVGLVVILAVAIVLIVIVKSPKKTTHFSASGSSKKRR